MILVTGLLETSIDNFKKNPRLEIVPHLDFKGVLNTDVHISINNGNGEWVRSGGIGYPNIDMKSVPGLDEAYNLMLNIIQDYIVQDISNKNPECSFEILQIGSTGSTGQ